MSTALLDLDALLAPIPGDNPAGESVPFAIRTELEEARKEIEPDPDNPLAPTEPKKADWPEIIKLTTTTLTNTSKDLLLAARLTEALTKQHGFPGLEEGLRLLRQLIEQCWDRIHPSIEDGDLEVRAGPFNWMGDADRAARFPHALRRAPLVRGEEASYGWQDWRLSQDGKGEVTREAFDKAVQAAPREECQAVFDALRRSFEEFATLSRLLTEKLGPLAPGMTDLRLAIEECYTLAKQMLERKGPAPVEAGENGEEGAEGETNGQSGGGRRMLTRADVYQRLTEAADLLQQMEPHSPIPYFIRRAVELGALPFPQLMRALIREDQVLTELNRELGIKEENPG